MTDQGVYLHGYEDKDGNTQEPRNLGKTRKYPAKSRSSPSPSCWLESEFKHLRRENRRAGPKAPVMVNVVPLIAGYKDCNYNTVGDISFKNMERFDPNVTTPKPDLYYSDNPSQIDSSIRDDISQYIIPSPDTKVLWTGDECVRFSLEYKSCRSIRDSLPEQIKARSQSIPEGALPVPEGLCSTCSAIDWGRLFLSLKLHMYCRQKFSLPDYDKAQSACGFCHFLAQARELARPHGDDDLIRDGSRIERLYFTQDVPERPWYRSISIDLSPIPTHPHSYAWLQVGSEISQVCVAMVPRVCQSAQSAQPNADSPRRRNRNEAHQGMIDHDLVQSWLQICTTRHSDICGKHILADVPLMDLYIVDVLTRTVKAAKLCDRYIALSYVWGDRHRCEKKQYDVSFLSDSTQIAGTPLPHEGNLPRTIEDAMVFTASIGERFLWVDALCIKLDQAHRQSQLNNMGLIYHNAFLTLIALDGHDADAGLCGVSRPKSQVSQPSLATRYGDLMATYLPSLMNSSWDERAWTLQESLLSRRTILFDKHQTIWRCQCEYFPDLLDVDTSVGRATSIKRSDNYWDNSIGVDLQLPFGLFATFSDFLSIYSGRRLTYLEDVLNACRGILSLFTKMTDVVFWEGLLVTEFPASLLWKAHPEHCLQRHERFASWSWAGWLGRVEYTWWLHDMESFPDLALLGPFHDVKLHRRSKRLVQRDTKIACSLPRAIISIGCSHIGTQVLNISSHLTKFKVKLIRRQGKRSQALRPELAVGDEWTLINSVGEQMQDATGEYETFRQTGHFYQLHPDISVLVDARNREVSLLFFEFWPWIRDSDKSGNWQTNMVGALVLIEDHGGTYMRIASLVLRLKDWVDADPQPTEVCIS